MDSQQKSSKVNEIFAQATPEQQKWVIARLSCKSDAAAARKVGINKATVSRWPNKPQLDEAVKALLQEPVVAILEILTQHGIEAAQVLADELRHKNKLAAANDILDRILGKPSQPVTGAGGGPIEITRIVIGGAEDES